MLAMFVRLMNWAELSSIRLEESLGEVDAENPRWILFIGFVVGLFLGTLAVWATIETETSPSHMLGVWWKTAITISAFAVVLLKFAEVSWARSLILGACLGLGIGVGGSIPLGFYWFTLPGMDRGLVSLGAVAFYSLSLEYEHPADRLSTKELIAPGSPLLL